ncbi:MAG: hypothetical protein SCAL_001767 [Candidatus Syntrophoarchaeum caldarius]|uniref:Uncharacterized protein n=1 Tax=Candidatus Syntropharchaeum caldarium TaxID=1838285 RepID=A0A1F2P811_9EURY|nr:MAG: hypothetical protein SCAL_001767 [Candidatus Syntrophoarchaeum caldarius]
MYQEYFVIPDAGFFSEENIKELYNEEIQFLIRLPSLRKLYKRLIVPGVLSFIA